MTLHPSLAPRVVAGCRAGRMILTPTEAENVYHYLVRQPRTAVALLDGSVIEVRLVPVTILDPQQDPDLDFLSELDPDEEWTRPHLDSYLEGLLDADDLRRLLP